MVSRRVLEMLTYLAKNHPNVAKLLLHLELPQPYVCERDSSVQGRGKAIMEEDKPEHERVEYSIVLLLGLLNQPLYMRSVAHLEQVSEQFCILFFFYIIWKISSHIHHLVNAPVISC